MLHFILCVSKFSRERHNCPVGIGLPEMLEKTKPETRRAYDRSEQIKIHYGIK